MKEFDLIDDFFKKRSHQRKDVLVGIGDDCAITTVPQGQSLAITTDTLVSGVHFLPDAEPEAIAHKLVAVNLSDLAAMGAEPAWVSLSLSIPEVDTDWLDRFSSSLKYLTDYYSVQLIGGDTVRGPLSLTMTAHGFVPAEQALGRSKAKPGDWLYVTGTLGDAGLGLDILQKKVNAVAQGDDYLVNRHSYPTPRMLAGSSLRRVANSCIDVSDGVVSDLKHILKASSCGAVLQVDQLPLSDEMLMTVDREQAYRYALSAGDDYELLFSVSEEQKGNLNTVLSNFNVPVTCIGHLTGCNGKLELKLGKEVYPFDGKGYEHF